ncbi:hypothetical protein [Kitasatospora sp. NPDC059327]
MSIHQPGPPQKADRSAPPRTSSPADQAGLLLAVSAAGSAVAE